MSKIISFLKTLFSFWRFVRDMKRDADRYRYLRSTSGEGLDAEIDKQMAKEKLL